MEPKTKGAWIVHHKNKLDTVTGAKADFENIDLAGKCSTLLSAISGSGDESLDNDRLCALATANGISKKIELPTLLTELERQRLISRGHSGIDVLGVTSATILEYTAKIFEDSDPNNSERAVLDFSEKASEAPITLSLVKEEISDIYWMDDSSVEDVLVRSMEIGFFDHEKISDTEELLFNGHLFRRKEVVKISKVLGALSEHEIRKMKDANTMLDQRGCIPYEDVIKVSGKELFEKLQSIGMYDVNSVMNEDGTALFVTKPSSFCKYTSSIVDDAFDLAKAFVTSLTYGMIKSYVGRGQIRMIEALMRRLIAGHWVGPATAIGQDYKILELKGVIKVKPESHGMYSMKLLKADVGRLALAVIQEGTVATSMLDVLPEASLSGYISPETNRDRIRKKMSVHSKTGVAVILDSLRTGEL